MTYTHHGHHIDGTIKVGPPPRYVARCGGIGLCNACSNEAEAVRALVEITTIKESKVDIETSTDMQERAKLLVAQYFNTKVEKTDQLLITTEDVYVVWFTKTLQNWKALLSTIVPDGMYYELTYDGDKKTTYFDAYKKWENVAIPDGGHLHKFSPREE